jgi:hypothetical protein
MPPPATTTSNVWGVTETMLAGGLVAEVDAARRAYVALPDSTLTLGPLENHVVFNGPARPDAESPLVSRKRRLPIRAAATYRHSAAAGRGLSMRSTRHVTAAPMWRRPEGPTPSCHETSLQRGPSGNPMSHLRVIDRGRDLDAVRPHDQVAQIVRAKRCPHLESKGRAPFKNPRHRAGRIVRDRDRRKTWPQRNRMATPGHERAEGAQRGNVTAAGDAPIAGYLERCSRATMASGSIRMRSSADRHATSDVTLPGGA